MRDAISGIRNDLPPEMEEPVLRKFDPDDMPIVSLVLSSDRMAPAELTLLADPGITRELRGINGVAQVTVVGNVDREISIDVRPADIAAAGVTMAQVVQAVQAQNLAAPVGRDQQAPSPSSRSACSGRLESPEDFAQLVVSSHNGQLIRLGPGGRRARRHRRAALARPVQRPATRWASTSPSPRGRARPRVSDAVKAAIAQNPDDPAAGGEADGRARRRRAGASNRCATSRRR